MKTTDEYRYIGKDGKPILARELEDQRDDLKAKLAKAVEALSEIVVDETFGLEHSTYIKCRKVLMELTGEPK